MAGGDNLTELAYDIELDVIGSYPCKAHEDAINCVTYIPELKHVTTCAFDYHVFVWNCEGIKPTKPFVKPNRAMPQFDDEDSADLEEVKIGEESDDDTLYMQLPEKVGSLLLGNKALPPDATLDAE